MKNLFTFFFVFLLFAFHASGQYITIWKTDNAGESANNQIIIPATGTDYSVAWEEVGNPANNGATTASGHYTLTFPAPGIYQVSISPGSGTFTQINFGGESDVKYVLSGNFVQPVDAWNVSNVTDMFLMFALADSFNQPVNNWDVTTVTNMLYMFAIAANFNQPLSKWTLASARVMLSMLQGTQMDCVNMGLTLQGWAANVATPDSLIFGAEDISYGVQAAAAMGSNVGPVWPYRLELPAVLCHGFHPQG